MGTVRPTTASRPRHIRSADKRLFAAALAFDLPAPLRPQVPGSPFGGGKARYVLSDRRMRHFSLSLLMILAATAIVAAEPRAQETVLKNTKVKRRAANASAPRIACTNQHQTAGISCDGIERYRAGMGANSSAYMVKKDVGAVAMYQVWSTQFGGLVASQAIAAVGLYKAFGRGWIQGGPGIARIGVHEGPRSIGTMKTIAEPRPALAGGVGMNVDNSKDPASVALDFGTTIDSKDNEQQVYQVGASFLQRF